MSLIFGVSGKAGHGKDTIADLLVSQHGFKKIALADAMKRFLREVFDFSEQQLWGPSEDRNAPDFRYSQTEHQALQHLASTSPSSKFEKYRRHLATPPEGVRVQAVSSLSTEFLSPRTALQALGTEWGRAMYPWVWIDLVIRMSFQLLQHANLYDYTPQEGLVQRRPERPIEGIVISDIRFENEMRAISEVDGRLIRVRRPQAVALSAAVAQHSSEQEQDRIPDEAFDAVVENNGTLEDLARQVDYLVYELAPSVKKDPGARFIDPRASLHINREPK